jgi:ABC-type transport system involved in cytochrome c biogenesis permease subunit
MKRKMPGCSWRGRLAREDARHAGETPAARLSKILSAILIFVFAAKVSAMNVSALRPVPVLDNGRVKPIDTVARDTLRFVTGQEKYDGREALDIAMDWAMNPQLWQKRKLLYVPLIELRKKLGMTESEKLIEPDRVRTNGEYRTWVAELDRRRDAADRTGEVAQFSRVEEAGMELERRLAMFDAACDARLYCVTPSEGSSAWVPLFQVTGEITPVRIAWEKLTNAWRTNDQNAFDAASTELIAALRDIGGPNYADAARVQREVFYNTVKPFRIAWVIYLLAVAGMVGALIVRNKWVYRLGLGIFVTAVVFHISAFALRCSITGWAPVTNMYETIIWVALVASIVSLVLEAIYRRRTIAIGGATVAVLATVIADVMPPEYGRSMRNLTPVLRSNYWLIIHVLTIVSSYAAFALAMVMGNITLAQYWARAKSEAIRENLNTIYRAIQIGVLLVAAGTILGGMWADVSWGRFWGWDPKEVWALIVLLTYLALLHGRFAGWIGQFGLAAGSILCWTTVIMSWYGVNFVLGVGLHAYGFGTGGQGYVATYVLLQWIYVAMVWMIVHQRNKLVTSV